MTISNAALSSFIFDQRAIGSTSSSLYSHWRPSHRWCTVFCSINRAFASNLSLMRWLLPTPHSLHKPCKWLFIFPLRLSITKGRVLARYGILVTHTGTLSINLGPIQRPPISISYLLDTAGFSISGTTENSRRAKLFTFGTICENEEHIRGRAVTAIVDEVHLLCTLSCLEFSILPFSHWTRQFSTHLLCHLLSFILTCSLCGLFSGEHYFTLLQVQCFLFVGWRHTVCSEKRKTASAFLAKYPKLSYGVSLRS